MGHPLSFRTRTKPAQIPQKRGRARGQGVHIRRNGPHPSEKGRGRKRAGCSRLEVVVVVEPTRRHPLDHLWLTFGREGGGGGGRCIERVEKNHLRLAFGGERGGGRGRYIENQRKTTSGSRLDAREVVVTAVASKSPPLHRLWMRGRWWQWRYASNGHYLVAG